VTDSSSGLKAVIWVLVVIILGIVGFLAYILHFKQKGFTGFKTIINEIKTKYRSRMQTIDSERITPLSQLETTSIKQKN